MADPKRDENIVFSPLTMLDGGMAYFPAVFLSNGKKLASVTADSGTHTVTAEFSDENVYSVTGRVSHSGNVTEITKLSALWNGADAPVNAAFLGLLPDSSDVHPDRLTYKDYDPDYELPEDITPASGETFDTITETWYAKTDVDEDINVIWGVGILNKGTSGETAVRLIYPDFSQLELVGFDF